MRYSTMHCEVRSEPGWSTRLRRAILLLVTLLVYLNNQKFLLHLVLSRLVCKLFNYKYLGFPPFIEFQLASL